MQNPKDNIYAYLGKNIPISSESINKTGYMLNERVKITSKTGIAIASAANSNLDGTGTTYDLITGAGYGTLVTRTTIKAQGTTTQGMIRIFYVSGASYWLMREVEVPAVTPDATHQAFAAILDIGFNLTASHKLKVSTEKGETFIITAEGLQYGYPA